VVTQTADVWDWDDRAAGWRLGNPRDGSIFVQREVCPPFVIVHEVALQVAAQRAFVPHDDVMRHRVADSDGRDALRAVYRPTPELVRSSQARADHRRQLVAERNREIVGTVSYEIRGDKLHLQSLAVDPVWQRQGIGRTLVAHVAELARSLGASRLSLYTVVETGNVIIFERLGFRVVSTESGCGLEAVAAATVTEVYMEMPIDLESSPTN
jgi:N-acetylglutamate synthase-like GNAT family acetyltransferase